MKAESTMTALLERITFDQQVLAGKPLVRGMRISVEMIVELLAKGATEQEILADYPQLEANDIKAALYYAYCLVAGETIIEQIAA
jgi:uncharacterized protein (DUF433 family)